MPKAGAVDRVGQMPRFTKKSEMLTRRDLVSTIAFITSGWAVAGAAAQEKDTLPKPSSPLVLAQEHVEQLLLLMDTKINGKISKQEWMEFMSAEFDRLDKNKAGLVDVREIAASRWMATRHNSTGK
jgi:hypothetical protein